MMYHHILHRSLSADDDGDETTAALTNSTAEDFFAATTTEGIPETKFEKVFDIILGLAFISTAVLAARRTAFTRREGGPETTVVAAFYSLIFVTSVLRALWFFIPATNGWFSVRSSSYTPVALYAWEDNDDDDSWITAALSEILLTAGSLALFSIFLLILVYWADILKKYFHPGTSRSIPMVTFLGLVALLIGLELLNILGFLLKLYTTEGMILVNSCLLATVSIICVCEITIFSHRFRKVLRTLGAINQVSTESQIIRIVWITITGNLFFFTRAMLETMLCAWLVMYWKKEGTVAKVFSHKWWDTYVLAKFWSEVTILGLMLYILQSRFATQQASRLSAAAASNKNGYNDHERPAGYVTVPNAEPNKEGLLV
mmetsp:Transcript_23703/g.66931  ORF Transcript_23703/g.66931 Transcript_23703/m.66931 type:complete len:373 (-) Transcript_23703:106-1224(-)|eukprot:CAMPEP_0119558484 /NCGR_PEP_ID=MMETSP1352-20130426/10816_1 /TAXON_ID=265584 /ORGANISM="Stauroneis constricta, Strain CCMP1120" /LENGTH=372 /DNA_ID=CAMNT_0007605857 /DNA_START=228 /DNA_END=1346 /DNA_ORIENTATION=-